MFAIKVASVEILPMYGFELLPYSRLETLVISLLRSTVMVTCPTASGLVAACADGVTNVFACQLSRKNPWVAAIDGSVGGVMVVVVSVLLLPPPPPPVELSFLQFCNIRQKIAAM